MLSRFFHFCLWVSGVVIGCFFYGLIIEPKRLTVRYIDIASPNWSNSPITISLVTDIHIGGPDTSAKAIAKLVDRINKLESDFILIPGDFINGHHSRDERSDQFNREVNTGLAVIRNLSANKGVFVSMGNHDAWYDAGYVKNELTLSSDITVLDNQAAILEVMCLVGVADIQTGQPDPAVFDPCPADKPIIAFMHSPDAKDVVPRRAALILAGHTHGGQVNLPLIRRRVTATELGMPYAYGLVWDGAVPVFISAGIGTSILPIRFRSPPEIVKITLRAAD